MSNVQPPIPGAPIQKKGMPAIAWVGIGCGGVVLIAIVAFGLLVGWGIGKAKEFAKNPSKSAAELLITSNKDLEKVSSNDETGEMTIRVKSTGEQITLKYDDIAQGRITVKDKDGKTIQYGQGDLAKVPSWVPRFSGASGETALFQTEDSSEITGSLTYTTTITTEALKSFYAAQADGLSMSSNGVPSSAEVNGTTTASFSYSGGGKELSVTAFGRPGAPLNVTSIYKQKK